MISQQKIKEWVDIFLNHVKEITPEKHASGEEGYKFKSVDVFQKNFDMNAPDFADMLERAIEFNNLVSGTMYFPRRMLLFFAREYEIETKEALQLFFDEQKNIAERLTKTQEAFDRIMNTRNQARNEQSNSYMGLRFLSLLLGFKYANTSNPIKPREWKVFCKYVDDNFSIPNHTPIGEQYSKLEPGIEALRQYIKTIPAMQKLRDQLTSGLSFRDEEFRWMAQNVIYVTARVLARQKEDVKEIIETETVEAEEEIISGEMAFPLEKNLEDFVIKNWDNIDFGEELEMYMDEDGTVGQQYTTEVGIIDILAKDKDGNFVVLELKRGPCNYSVIGQTLAYIAWVRANLAQNGQNVRGMIIVNDGNNALHAAQREVADKITIKYYRVKLDLVNP